LSRKKRDGKPEVRRRFFSCSLCATVLKNRSGSFAGRENERVRSFHIRSLQALLQESGGFFIFRAGMTSRKDLPPGPDMKLKLKIYPITIVTVVCLTGTICFLAAKSGHVPASFSADGTNGDCVPAAVVSRCSETASVAAIKCGLPADEAGSADNAAGAMSILKKLVVACDAEEGELRDEKKTPEAIAALKEKFMRERFGAICRQDKWIPTIDGGTNLVYITTGSLSPGRVGEAYGAQFLATSGFPPYSWGIVGGELPKSFSFDTHSGILSGTPLEPGTTIFFLQVTDSMGAKDVAKYVLTFQPEQPLEIATEFLSSALPGQDYFCQLQASGGVPPYTWSASIGDIGEVGTLFLDMQTGQISGQISESSPQIDVPIIFYVNDSQLYVSKEFTLHVRSELGILNAPQSSVYESEQFEFSFQAAGGVAPYIWSASGSIPPGLEFSGEGLFSGKPSEPGSYDISVWVQDAEGQADTAQFTLTVLPEQASISAFQALLSRNSVALSWKLPEREKLNVLLVRNSKRKPLTPLDGKTVYCGSGTSYLDSDIGEGNHYYTAFLEENGSMVTSASPPTLCATLPPETDPFADRVVSKNLLHPNAFRAADLPQIVLGAPRGTGLGSGSLDIVSLGAAINDDGGAAAPYGGSIMLEFTDNLVWDGPGVDFTIFENVFYICNAAGTLDPETRFMEPAIVSVSQDGVNWLQFPVDFSPRYDPESGELNLRHPYCYNSGFAGVNPVMSNGYDPDPTDPAMSGGDSFDISALGLEWIRYALIQSTGSRWLMDKDGDLVYHNEETGAATRSNNKSGFDLDAVTAIWMKKVSASENAE